MTDTVIAARIQPLGARLLVKPMDQESKTSSGILLPETAKEKPQTGVVVAVGDDEEIKLKEGDKVLFAKYTGTEFKYRGEEYLVIEQNDILAYLLD